MVARSGFQADGLSRISVPFLDRAYRIESEGFTFTDLSDKNREIPIQEQILILHYLAAESPARVSGKWVAYREIPGATFYWSAFVKRAINPLKKRFGQSPEAFSTAAQELSGRPAGTGDASSEVWVFPRVPVQLILWQGDDEFPSEANIIFDESIGAILSPEDIAWMAGMVVYRMIALAG